MLDPDNLKRAVVIAAAGQSMIDNLPCGYVKVFSISDGFGNLAAIPETVQTIRGENIDVTCRQSFLSIVDFHSTLDAQCS